jgi:Holliday junction resolvase RusA-like endonuclease
LLQIKLSLPPRELSPNAKVHHQVRAKAVAIYRKEAYFAAIEALSKGPKDKPPVVMDVEFYTARKKGHYVYYPRDIDNALASLKAAIDGIVDAKVIPSDSAKYLSIGKITIHAGQKDAAGLSCVIITIRAKEEAP